MSAECKNLRDASSVGPECSCHTGVCVLGIERGATMTTDHAQTVREAILGREMHYVGLDALDALVAERGEARDALSVMAESELDGAMELIARVRAAEADRDTLAAALRQIVIEYHPGSLAAEIARAALARLEGNPE